MFLISMPTTFKVGDTEDCRINGKPEKITWRDRNTLVIEPNDARQILNVERTGDMLSFSCASEDGSGMVLMPFIDNAGEICIVQHTAR